MPGDSLENWLKFLSINLNLFIFLTFYEPPFCPLHVFPKENQMKELSRRSSGLQTRGCRFDPWWGNWEPTCFGATKPAYILPGKTPNPAMKFWCAANKTWRSQENTYNSSFFFFLIFPWMLYSHELNWFTQILVILHPKTSIAIQMPLQLGIITITK